ncbi:hemoglobin [Labrys miyagiensis]|uniref:Hemoglobin n=1 Tax=Labrys miyagiensis TaxID=346912 RepID=A0ABQ6CG83_9HYPH|nr:globin family protein [Labrys miyagiensis]GLS17316.1 hemoglobin [Labrys miyagiensis]
MTPREIDLVQTSFAKVIPIADTAAGLFYERLFEIAPEVRPMFPADLAEQRRKLMAALGMVVGGLRKLDAILPAVKTLAVRHVGYGVSAAHYAPVGEALVWTLQQGLGEGFSAETREAWLLAYRLLAGAMIAEAYGKETAA